MLADFPLLANSAESRLPLTMRRVLVSLFVLAPSLLLTTFLFCPPLAAQRRPGTVPFPDDDLGLSPSRGRSFTISGSVSDADTHAPIAGARVDLQALSGGTLASEFTGNNGSFAFTNVRSGSYQLIFEQSAYQDAHETVEVEGPVFGMNILLRKLSGGAGAGGPTVSVRELSMPEKARDAMAKGLNLLYQKADYPGSIKQFQRAIAAYPDYYEAYAQMGLAYMNMKNAAESEKALRKSIEMSQGKYADALFLLAALFSGSNRYADAEPLARKAVSVDPNSWHAQSELAHALLRLERADEAEQYAQAAVKLQPENPNLRLLLADVHISLRNAPALLDDLNAYLKLAPNGPSAAQVRERRDQLQQQLQKSQASPAAPSGAQANP
jgi:Flp pilus assembly protein TadD